MHKIDEVATRLFDYCKQNNWAGYDPYDALNSRLFARTLFSRSRICRIAATQIIKRLPVNIRPLLMITGEQNPKALALFLMSFVKLSKIGLPGTHELIGMMADRLAALRSPNTPYWCWGYSFPWQGRAVLVERGAPNLVCTVFSANALLDAYEYTGNTRCLDIATSAAEYIINELYWTDGGDIAGFSYPLPSLRIRVHNANFLGAALLCRIYRHTGDEKFLEPALKTAGCSASAQHDDGSWDYGEHSTQNWVDNFHTGYNLCALRSIGRSITTSEFETRIRRGFAFYKAHFFREDGAPKYYHNRVYPIDIHSAAQSIITLLEFRDLDPGGTELVRTVSAWTMNHMLSEEGYFYYQVHPYYKNRISYMRWSQAWMLLALTSLLENDSLGASAKN